MAQIAGVELPANWAPVYRSRASPGVEAGVVVIQNSCRGALYAATTKEWPFKRWDLFAERLISERHKLVQIGTIQDPLVSGAVDLRGKTNLPRAAAILEQARLFIGLESGLMHLAAAVRVPSVIIYGGRTRPGETGYPWHWHAANLQIECAGCALNTGCPHDMKCMEEISVEQVHALAERALAGEKKPEKDFRPQLVL
jgi:ADP-heptose:LPS heptosyltransferase